MIVDFILNLIYVVISGFLNLLPTVSVSDGVLSAVSTANSYISALSMIFPVSTLIAILGLVLSIEAGILLIKIINWFIRKIPTIS